MPNIIKSNYVLISKEDVKIIDSNVKSDGFSPILGKQAVVLPHDDEKEEDKEDFKENLLAPNIEEQVNLEEVASQSEEILEEARIQAEQIKQEALMQASESIKMQKEQAIQSGYQEGYQQGIDQLELEKEKLKELEQDLIREYDLKLEELQSDVAELLIAYVGKLVGVVLEDQKDVILYLVSEALKGQPSCNEYTIKVSSQDFSMVCEQQEELTSLVKRSATLSVVEDSTLKESQCLIETDRNIMDCGIQTKLNNLTTDIRLLACDYERKQK